MKTTFSIESKPGGFAGWEALLKEWAALMDRYVSIDPNDKDVPYWYGEAANSGLVAAAAWRLPDGWSIEEFTGKRDSGRTTGVGRGDLWLGYGQYRWTVEAKIAWPSGQVNAINGPRRKLSAAEEQLKSLSPEYRCGLAVAVCYVVPELKEETETPDTVFSDIAAQFGKDHLVATFRCPAVHKRKLYPGVAFIGKRVPWERDA